MWCLALTSHTGAGARPTRTRNKPSVTVVSVRYASAMSCLGVAANAAVETAGHPHQVGIFEGFVRSGQRPPPHPKPTGTMPHAEVGVQNDPIHAIVAAVQQILIESAKSIAHARYATSTPLSFKLPRRGHFFEARSAKKRRSLEGSSPD